jgi:ribonuclease HI
MGPSPRPDPADELLALELALARRDLGALPRDLEAVLDPGFVEFGQSGRRWDRDGMIEALAASPPAAHLRFEDFRVDRLADDVALVTYRIVGPTPTALRGSLRSSIWLRSEGGWRLRFHQGTAQPDPGAAAGGPTSDA